MSSSDSDSKKVEVMDGGEVSPVVVPRKRGLPIPTSIFEVGERTVQFGTHGFLIGSILGLVAVGSARGTNFAPGVHYEQIANTMGKSGALVSMLLASYTLTVQSLELAQGRKDHVLHQGAGFAAAGLIAGGLKYSLMENTIDPVKFRFLPAIKGAAVMGAGGAIVAFVATKFLMEKNEPNSTARALESKVTNFLFPSDGSK